MSKRRNPVVRFGALLRKGGAHTESVSGKRHRSKRQLDDEIDDYYELRLQPQRNSIEEQDDSAPRSAPLSLLNILKKTPANFPELQPVLLIAPPNSEIVKGLQQGSIW